MQNLGAASGPHLVVELLQGQEPRRRRVFSRQGLQPLDQRRRKEHGAVAVGLEVDSHVEGLRSVVQELYACGRDRHRHARELVPAVWDG